MDKTVDSGSTNVGSIPTRDARIAQAQLPVFFLWQEQSNNAIIKGKHKLSADLLNVLLC
jgi:hypothetical protein